MMAPARSVRLIDAGAVAAILLAAGAVERHEGRSLLCRCGVVRLWAGTVQSPQNSQQLADWYSLSHVVHGLLLYAALRLALPKQRLGVRLIVAALVEAAWEVAENSAAVIARYRAETVSWGYAGDSILNSMGDILFMLLGFVLAARLRTRWAILLGLTLEATALAAIRDNLTLNIVMLVHPFAAIRAWQGG